MREVADRWAAHGYLCIAPAMFDRVEFGYESEDYGPGGFAKMGEIFKTYSQQTALLDMAAALRAAGNKDVTFHQVKGRTHMSVWTEMLDGESEETSTWILRFAERILK